VFSAKAAQKIRKREQGHAYAERQLVDRGARPMRPGENPATWLREALGDTGARRVRHKGVLRYGFRLGTDRRQRSAVVIALPSRAYPKTPDLEAAA
jgi:hypothetical protein